MGGRACVFGTSQLNRERPITEIHLELTNTKYIVSQLLMNKMSQ